MTEFKVKFRGIRGSYPVCLPDRSSYGGNTACIEVLANGFLIILDAGTGIIELGNDLMKRHIASGTSIANREPVETVLLLSHSHMDHLQGLPFFKPLYLSSTKINLFGSRVHGKDFKDFVSESVFHLLFPLELEEIPAQINIENLKDNVAIILDKSKPEPEIVRFNAEEEIQASKDAVVITNYNSLAHPKEGVNVFKIKCCGKSLVYATDKESYVGGDTRLINFARSADLLIHDSQYTAEDYSSNIAPKQGYGHSTPEMAAEAAKLANVKQLAYYHLDPAYDDDFVAKLEEKGKALFLNSFVAKENMEIDLLQD